MSCLIFIDDFVNLSKEARLHLYRYIIIRKLAEKLPCSVNYAHWYSPDQRKKFDEELADKDFLSKVSDSYIPNWDRISSILNVNALTNLPLKGSIVTSDSGPSLHIDMDEIGFCEVQLLLLDLLAASESDGYINCFSSICNVFSHDMHYFQYLLSNSFIKYNTYSRGYFINYKLVYKRFY